MNSHVLHSVEAFSIAKRVDNDDILFYLPNNKYSFAVVHLTWSKENKDSEFPLTRFYSSLEEWIDNCMKIDHENY